MPSADADGFNRRVKKDLASGTDVLYLYDAWQVVEERELDGETWEARRQYVYGGQYIDEILLFDKDTDSDGDCTEGEGAGSKRYLYCQNNNFNVMALTDASGAAAERYKYDPYGACTVTLDDSSANPYRFQGRRLDAETGLYYFRNRMMSPTLGGWMQRDPTGYADGMSLYQFESSLPTGSLDPSGYRQRLSGKGTIIGKGWRHGLQEMDYEWELTWGCTANFEVDTDAPVVTGGDVTLEPDQFYGGAFVVGGAQYKLEKSLKNPPGPDCPPGIRGETEKWVIYLKWVVINDVHLTLGFNVFGVGLEWGEVEIWHNKDVIGTDLVVIVMDCCCNPDTGKPRETSTVD